MKAIIKLLLIAVFILPISINANEICKDGSISPTCNTCGQGCCSHHGGCTGMQSEDNENQNYSDSKTKEEVYSENNENGNSMITTSAKDSMPTEYLYLSGIGIALFGSGFLFGKGSN